MRTIAIIAVIAQLPVLAVETPTMGWSSWNTYRCNINDDLIRSQADAMVATGLKDCGYDHINIDDGWFGGRDENGRLTTNLKRFPNGMKPVVDYIHSKGLKAGAYSDAGENTCGSIFDADTLGKGVGFYQHDAIDAKFFFTEMGFDFIKVDFCGGLAIGNSEKIKMCERERYTAIRKAIDDEGFPKVRMNICRWNYPGTWVPEAGFSWRVTPDIAEGWESMKSTLNEDLFLAPYAFDGHYNDIDMLEIGRGMTLEEDRTHFAMWCVLASPLLIGCDLTTIKPETLEILKNRDLIAVNQDRLGLQAAVVKQYSPSQYALVKDLEEFGGTTRCLAFYSWDGERDFSIDFEELDLGGRVKVRELVEGKDLGVMEGRITYHVPSHGTRVFRLEAEKRLERKSYPAHWAYLSKYQEIVPEEMTANYAHIILADRWWHPVVGVGGAADDYMLWRHVHSIEGGDYTLRFTTFGESAGFDVIVNGEKAGFASKENCYRVDVRLEKGMNEVRLGNDSAKIGTILEMVLEHPTRIACIGDSITEGYLLENRARDSYPAQLQRKLGYGYEVRNFGDPGKGVTMYPYVETDLYRDAVAFRPDIVIANLGANDWIGLDEERYVDEYLRILEPFKGERIIIWTPLAPITTVHQSHGSPAVAKVNALNLEVAKRINAEAVDMYVPLHDHEEEAVMSCDGIHLTACGYDIVSDVVRNCIERR